ncbi:hypothetical protein D3C86_1559970 [compost metagenome]
MSAAQKFHSSMPIWATMAQAISTMRPDATIFSATNREISMPVKKLGPNMASTCHWMPSVASSVGKPQPITMASGAPVIMKVINA